MEPESHRLDREAMLADRLAVTERVRREVDEAVTAAAQKRRAHSDRFVEGLLLEVQARVQAQAQEPVAAPAAPDGEAAGLLVAVARTAEEVRDASRALAEARELSALVEAQTEREQAALAEIQERRGLVERELDEILAQTEHERTALAEMHVRRGQVEREADEILAHTERERAARADILVRREQVATEVDQQTLRARLEAYGTGLQNGIFAQTERERVALAEIEERREQVEPKADENDSW